MNSMDTVPSERLAGGHEIRLREVREYLESARAS